jgi:hypothetical protein
VGTAYDLPAGAEAFIMERLAALLPLAYSAPAIRLASAVKAAEREYPELADWPAGLVLHSVRHADVRVMADLRAQAGKPRPFRLAGGGLDDYVVNDIIGDAMSDDEEDAR